MFEVFLLIIFGHASGNLELVSLAMHDLALNAVDKKVASNTL